MEAAFRAYVEQEQLLPPGERVVVGVSGGVDSVVLLHLLHAVDVPLEVAHVNYHLRGAESDADEALVRALCTSMGVGCRVARVDLKNRREAEGRSTSLQALARSVRYQFFADVARSIGASAVATAHHADDQAETILLNLFRGAGPRGLAGMSPRRPMKPDADLSLIRPLLFARRSELLAYAAHQGLGWREDASNRNLNYRRAAVRHQILPVVTSVFGDGVIETINRAGRLLSHYHETDTGDLLDVERLLELPRPKRLRKLLDALHNQMPGAPRSYSVAEQLERLLHGQTGRFVAFSEGRVWRDRERLVFEVGKEAPFDSGFLEVTVPGIYRVPGGVLETAWGEPPERFDDMPAQVAYIDAGRLDGPLKLRAWQPGDRFRPLHMKGTKRISDYLTDEKIPTHRRQHVLVLTSGDAVVWVVGHRLAHPYRLTDATRRVVRAEFRPESHRPPVR